MIRALSTASAVAALALGLAAPAAAAPKTPNAASARQASPRPVQVTAFSSNPIYVRTSAVHAAPPSETDGETFPGQLAALEAAPPAPDPVPQVPQGLTPAPGTFLHQLAMAAPAAKPGAPARSRKTTKAPARPAGPALAESDWRELDPENALVIETTKGRVIVEMLPEAAPGHVQRIKELARAGLYDGLVFFRVIDRFMAQTGDPSNTGEGASEQANLKAEFIFRRDKDTAFTPVAAPMGLELGFIRSAPIVSQDPSYFASTGDGKVAAWGTYCPGVAGMARDEDPDSANSQFFIMRYAYPSLDKRYTIWGRAVAGLESVRAIKTGEPVTEPDKMTRVRVLADIPEAERPKVRVIDTRGAGFKRLVENARKARGADFSVCDVDLPVQVTDPTPPPQSQTRGGYGPAA
jgi:peptidylprolyl isomerase